MREATLKDEATVVILFNDLFLIAKRSGKLFSRVCNDQPSFSIVLTLWKVGAKDLLYKEHHQLEDVVVQLDNDSKGGYVQLLLTLLRSMAYQRVQAICKEALHAPWFPGKLAITRPYQFFFLFLTCSQSSEEASEFVNTINNRRDEAVVQKEVKKKSMLLLLRCFWSPSTFAYHSVTAA